MQGVRRHARSQIPVELEKACSAVAETVSGMRGELGYHGYFLSSSSDQGPLRESYEKLEDGKQKVQDAARVFLDACRRLGFLEEEFLQREGYVARIEDEWVKRREEILAWPDGE